MDLDEIRALIEAFGAADVAEMRLTRGGWTLHLVRSADGTVTAPTAQLQSRSEARSAKPAAETGVRAPLSGLVYLGPTPGAPDFVAVGREVQAGEVVAVIEAMKVFNEIRAERPGTVEALLVASGDEVDTGQLLMRIG